jgi:hypothetical protein
VRKNTQQRCRFYGHIRKLLNTVVRASEKMRVRSRLQYLLRKVLYITCSANLPAEAAPSLSSSARHHLLREFAGRGGPVPELIR